MSNNEPTTSSPIRILLVDDHPAVREGLGLLLAAEGICVCGEASGQAEALRSLAEARPDLALVDLSLGSEYGATLVTELCAREIPSLVYSMHEDIHHVESAFAAGARGYVTKRELQGVLVLAIREVAQGRRFVSPNAAIALADHIAGTRSHNGERELSDQERQVFHLLGEGEGTIEIAAAMCIKTRTVESYYARIMDKLGIEGMHDLRHYAINHSRDHIR